MTRIWLSALAVFVFGLGLVTPADAQASAKPRVTADSAHKKVIELNFNHSDTKEAVSLFLKAFKKPYRIGPEVKGSISLHFKNVPFDAALINLMAVADLSYELQGRTYVVSKLSHNDAAKPPLEVGPPSGDNRVTIDLTNTDVREALRMIFTMSRSKYSIAADVKGAVTLGLHNVPLESALKIICDSVGATWRIEAGVYRVERNNGF